MNNLLLFFALPIAVIIISIALQKIFKCPFLVSGLIFSTFLIVTFITENINMLIPTIIYTILSYITAVLTSVICKIIRKLNYNGSCFKNCCGNEYGNYTKERCNNDNELLRISSRCDNGRNGNLLTISSDYCNGNEQELLKIDSNTHNENSCNCDTMPNQREITARVNIVPNYNERNRNYMCRRCRRRF